MRLFGIFALWAALATNVLAGDWAYWRGPEMNGVSREKNLAAEWSLDPQKNVLWVNEIGGRATPCIINGRVYLNCRTHHDVSVGSSELINAGEQVICWDLKTGKELWKDVFPVYETDIPAPRVGWASMTGDTETGNVYVHSVSGLLRCYTADGKRVWERSLQEEFGEITGYGGRLTTPLVDEDRLIVPIPCLNWGETGNPPPKHTFYAFDKKTGELLWVASPGGAINDTFYSNPVIAVIDGVRQLISGNGDGGVYGINARTGEKLWGMKMSKRGLNVSPVVEGKYVYISHGEDNIDSLEFGRVQCIDATQRGDLTEGVWRANGVKAGYASPCIHDGVLYVVTDNGELIAFEAKDGKKLWEYKIGTVGKGSPVWADGKIYVMEVNGRIHAITAGREEPKVLSDVQLFATGNQKGTDEIYASPAVADGKVVFVTRDRTICVGKPESEIASAEVPSQLPEVEPGSEVASIQLRPYEVSVKAGDKIEYEVHAFDKNGRFLKTIDEFTLTVDDALKGASVENNSLTTAADAKLPQAGVVNVEAGGKTAKARIRSFPPLPWTWDMEGLSGVQVPAGWVNAQLKFKPAQMDGGTVLKNEWGPGKPAFSVWMGPPDMKSYVVQADMMVEGKRQIPSVGVSNQRYDLIIKANTLKLSLQTWPAHLRINEELKLEKDPVGKWYTLKFVVDPSGKDAIVRGKMWPRGEDEPEEWTLEANDPNKNDQGSPGLYVYRLPNGIAYIDNVIVSELNDADKKQ